MTWGGPDAIAVLSSGVSKAVSGRAKQLARRELDDLRRLNQTAVSRQITDLDGTTYNIRIGNGRARVFVTAPVPEPLRPPEIIEEDGGGPVTWFMSGFVGGATPPFRNKVDPNAKPYPTMHGVRLDTRAAAVASESPPGQPAGSITPWTEGPAERIAVAVKQHPDIDPPTSSDGYQHWNGFFISPGCYTGRMRAAVQACLGVGYGERYPKPAGHGRRITPPPEVPDSPEDITPYQPMYRFGARRTDGIVYATWSPAARPERKNNAWFPERAPVLCRISKDQGVLAMALPIIKGTDSDGVAKAWLKRGYPQYADVLYMLGGLPSGETFHPDDKIEDWIRAGLITRLVEPDVMADAFEGQHPMSPSVGWAFSYDGRHADFISHHIKSQFPVMRHSTLSFDGLTYAWPPTDPLIDVTGLSDSEKAEFDAAFQAVNDAIPNTPNKDANAFKLTMMTMDEIKQVGGPPGDVAARLDAYEVANKQIQGAVGAPATVKEGHTFNPGRKPETDFKYPVYVGADHGCISAPWPLKPTSLPSDFPGTDTAPMYVFYDEHNRRRVTYFYYASTKGSGESPPPTPVCGADPYKSPIRQPPGGLSRAIYSPSVDTRTDRAADTVTTVRYDTEYVRDNYGVQDDIIHPDHGWGYYTKLYRTAFRREVVKPAGTWASSGATPMYNHEAVYIAKKRHSFVYTYIGYGSTVATHPVIWEYYRCFPGYHTAPPGFRVCARCRSHVLSASPRFLYRKLHGSDRCAHIFGASWGSKCTDIDALTDDQPPLVTPDDESEFKVEVEGEVWLDKSRGVETQRTRREKFEPSPTHINPVSPRWFIPSPDPDTGDVMVIAASMTNAVGPPWDIMPRDERGPASPPYMVNDNARVGDDEFARNNAGGVFYGGIP